ncbi:glycerol-3-phosphate dehydrogenase/oxidase [Phenylobacterium sp. LjRoot225]|uniref:glycerol-3-phosphate dehydrogenase/oxidase n=1 Tax=Phenylobacterium sp. LjRoot225 TaxID=3342285 RepID=UPI003ED111EC
MKRDTASLTRKAYDVIVVGGGVNGAACALDATLRGLKVAVLERDDFGGATSSNSAKIAHSGMRYLQHADFRRMRKSIRERNLLIQNAPHLVRSQPVLFPVYGHGLKGREVMTIYLKIFDLLSPERRQFADPARRIPGSRLISKAEALKIAPGIKQEGLAGAVVWHEGQIQNTERLLMSVLRTAAGAGAEIANYTEVTRIVVENGAARGVEAIDRISGRSLSLQARLVVNASGPWINGVLHASGVTEQNYVVGSKAFSLLTRSLCDTHALSFHARAMYRDKKAMLDKGASIQFAIPWRGSSLIGSLHLPADDDPEKVGVSDEEIAAYIDMINDGYPAARLTRSDVKRVLWGMVPGESPGEAGPDKHDKIIDHAESDAIEGLISVAGVKFTTSRDVAEKAIDLACRKLGCAARSVTARTPLHGGDIASLDAFLHEGAKALSFLPGPTADRLLATYGTGFEAILATARERPELMSTLPGSPVLKAEVVHAVTEEMAIRLSDVVLRRTDLGSLQHPGEDALRSCAGIMAQEAGWDESQISLEIADLNSTSGYNGHVQAPQHQTAQGRQARRHGADAGLRALQGRSVHGGRLEQVRDNLQQG